MFEEHQDILGRPLEIGDFVVALGGPVWKRSLYVIFGMTSKQVKLGRVAHPVLKPENVQQGTYYHSVAGQPTGREAQVCRSVGPSGTVILAYKYTDAPDESKEAARKYYDI